MTEFSRHNVMEAKTVVKERGLEAARERVGPHFSLEELQLGVEELAGELASEVESQRGERVAEP